VNLLASLLWEQPQSLLGAANLALQTLAGNVRAAEWRDGRVMVRLRGMGAVSLGLFVFYSPCDSPWVPVGPENEQHERGHAVQSRRLGPMYLPLVGLASVTRVGFAAAHKALTGRRWAGYYDGWPEREADLLGGVDRALRPAP
jgi:hypothetical protein